MPLCVHPFRKTDQTAGANSWNTHVNCMKCRTWMQRIVIGPPFLSPSLPALLSLSVHVWHALLQLILQGVLFCVQLVGSLPPYWHFIKILHATCNTQATRMQQTNKTIQNKSVFFYRDLVLFLVETICKVTILAVSFFSVAYDSRFQ